MSGRWLGRGDAVRGRPADRGAGEKLLAAAVSGGGVEVQDREPAGGRIQVGATEVLVAPGQDQGHHTVVVGHRVADVEHLIQPAGRVAAFVGTVKVFPTAEDDLREFGTWLGEFGWWTY